MRDDGSQTRIKETSELELRLDDEAILRALAGSKGRYVQVWPGVIDFKGRRVAAVARTIAVEGSPHPWALWLSASTVEAYGHLGENRRFLASLTLLTAFCSSVALVTTVVRPMGALSRAMVRIGEVSRQVAQSACGLAGTAQQLGDAAVQQETAVTRAKGAVEDLDELAMTNHQLTEKTQSGGCQIFCV